MKNNNTIKMVEFGLSNQLLQAINGVGDDAISSSLLKHIATNGEQVIISHSQFKKLVGLSNLLNILVIQGNDAIIKALQGS